MKKFFNQNKKLVVLFLVFVGMLVFTFYNKYGKKEEVKQEQKVEQSFYKDYDTDDKSLKFLPYRIILDEEHKKIMLVYVKSETDFNSNFKYYIVVDGERKELKEFQSDEHLLVLESDILVKDKFKVVMENNNDKDDVREVEQELKDVIKYDLTKATKEKFDEHEKLSHHIISDKAAIKVAEKNIAEQEDLLKFTDEKIEEYKKQGKADTVKRYEKAKEEVENEIIKNNKVKEEKQRELEKLLKDNEELEIIFDKLFGGLHKH